MEQPESQQGNILTAEQFGQSVVPVMHLLRFDYGTLLQILITYALLLGQIDATPVGGELKTPPPYIRATTPTGKKFDIGLFGVRTA